jgi:hypothetical protein
MLGNSTIKNHFKNSYALDVKPRAFLEFNGNDIADPYFYGTGAHPSASYSNLSLSLTAPSGATVTAVNTRGLSTAISGTPRADLLSSVNSSRASEKTFKYTTMGPVGSKNIKFNMFLKSDYQHQLSQNNNTALESFDVVFKVYGINSSGKTILSETVTKVVSVNSVDWTPLSILFANPDNPQAINRVKLEILIQPPVGWGSYLLISQLTSASISEHEVYCENRMPISEVFETNRPGEFLVDMDSSTRPNVTIGAPGSTTPQRPTPVQMVTNYAVGPKYENLQRAVIPFEGNPYSYYVSGSNTYGTESQKIWSLYRSSFKTNKIVVKINNIAFKPNIFTIKILTSAGWVNVVASADMFDNNGILVLYYNGTAWTTTKWANHQYPRIRKSDGSIRISGTDAVGSINIHGIYFETQGLQIINTDFQKGSGASFLRLEMIEISPRLEIDVTDYLQSFNIIKEIDVEDSVLPIGGISANSANISLSNILITVSEPDILVPTDGDSDIPPFSNFSPLSPLKDMLKKGVKVRGGFDVDTTVSGSGISSAKTYIPAFVMYVDEWTDSDFSIDISAFDVVKNLQTMPCRPVYMRGSKINEVIRSVLDPVGFGDYYFDDLTNLRVLSRRKDSQLNFSDEEKISHFWTSNDNSITESLQNLFKVYQVGMYADEYGAIRFVSLYDYSSYYRSLVDGQSQVDFYVQDKTDVNSVSNLESVQFSENEKPQSINIKYRIPRVQLEEAGANKDEGKNPSLISKAKESTKIVWTLQEDLVALPYFEISDGGIRGIAQNYIPYSPMQSTSIFRYIPYSSLLLIEDEIVSYDGKEFEFNYTTPTRPKVTTKVIIKDPEDLNMVIRNLMGEQFATQVNYSETGRLMNVRRGLYGTKPSAHTKSSIAGTTKWRAREFTVSNKGYNNAVNINAGSKKFSNTEYGMQINCLDNNKIIFLSPNDLESNADILGYKKRLSSSFKIGDIPDSKEGYLGVALGVEIDSGDDIKSGLFIWFGKDTDKKKKAPTVFIEQLVDGERKTLVTKNEFEYNERLFDEDENLEVIVMINDKRNECTVLIGGTSAFAKQVTVKPKSGEQDESEKPSKEYRNFPVKLKQPLKRDSRFGVVASHFGSGIVGQFLFGSSRKPEDMNDLNIYNMKDSYSMYDKKTANGAFYIGKNTLLDTIVSKQLVPGFNDAASDNFVYTANPVGRGIKIFDVEYATYPITSVPKVEFLGYSYNLNIFRGAPLFTDKYADPEKEDD